MNPGRVDEALDVSDHFGEAIFGLEKHVIWAVQLDKCRTRNVTGKEFSLGKGSDRVSIAMKNQRRNRYPGQ